MKPTQIWRRNRYGNDFNRSIFTEDFIYDTDDKYNNKNPLKRLIFGYIREAHIKLNRMTKESKELIIDFYGGIYSVLGPPPPKTVVVHGHFDYVVRNIMPSKPLGIDIRFQQGSVTISGITSNIASKNFITGSQIIQINDVFYQWIQHDINREQFITLVNYAKKHPPLYIICRCPSRLAQKGFHVEYVVNIVDKSARFPYYLFTKSTLNKIFNAAFNDITRLYRKQRDDLYQVYGNTVTGQVSIFSFQPCLEPEYQFSKKDEAIEKAFRELDDRFIVKRKWQMYGWKGNRFDKILTEKRKQFLEINECFGKLVYKVIGKCPDRGTNVWYWVLVDPDKLKQFQSAIKSQIIHFKQYGHILYSAYDMTIQNMFYMQKCREMFQYDYETEYRNNNHTDSMENNDKNVSSIETNHKLLLQQKLKRTILRNRAIVTDGCGSVRCANPYCKSNQDNKNKIYTDREASKLAVIMTKERHKGCEEYGLRPMDHEDIIHQLMQMGYSRDICEYAIHLTADSNDFNTVLNTLQNMASLDDSYYSKLAQQEGGQEQLDDEEKYINHDDDTINQLMKFGYSQAECIKAIQSTTDGHNIAEVLNTLQNDISRSQYVSATKEGVTMKDCNGNMDVFSCRCMQRLLKLISVQQTKHILTTMDTESISLILNDYLHMLEMHGSVDDIESIHNQLDGCDINYCNVFRRNYKNKNLSIFESAYQQIFDKIHIYCHHSFDIGYRLSKMDRDQVEKSNLKLKNADHNSWLIHPSSRKVHEILQQKHTMMSDQCNTLLQTRTGKKNDQIKDVKNNDRYNFGQLFNYGHMFEKDPTSNKPSDVYPIKAKYGSLKEELLSNKIAVIAKQQYQNEYKKATLHFNSPYRRKQYKRISLQCILSLMIYCNFDVLQFKFSKTYRENIETHANFYYLGLFLKMSVSKHGEWHWRQKKLYHGVSKPLLLPEVIGCYSADYSSRGIYIFCPLSTSLEFTVAANFTNHNNGLILTFTNDLGNSKFMPVAWISDFPAESECLFVQNSNPLAITNISIPAETCHLELFLKAINTLQDMTIGVSDNCGAKKESEHTMCVLIDALIQDKVSFELLHYKPFQSLHSYARNLFDIYCQQKKNLTIHWNIQRLKNSGETMCASLHRLLFCKNYTWIKLGLIRKLFPNLEMIKLNQITLCPAVLDDILHNVDVFDGPLIFMMLGPSRDSTLTVEKAVETFDTKFKEKGCVITNQIRNSSWHSVFIHQKDNEPTEGVF
eukprot:97252_1